MEVEERVGRRGRGEREGEESQGGRTATALSGEESDEGRSCELHDGGGLVVKTRK